MNAPFLYVLPQRLRDHSFEGNFRIVIKKQKENYFASYIHFGKEKNAQ